MPTFNRVASLPLLLALVSVTALPTLNAQEPAPVAAPPITGQYIPPGATAVITLHPQAFFSQRSLRLIPLEMIRLAGEQELGINVLKIAQIQVVIGELGPQGPAFGIVARMAEAVDLKDLRDETLRLDQPQRIDGKVFYAVDGPAGTLLHQVDERTAIIGVRPLLEQMLAAGERPAGDASPLITAVQSLESSNHLSVVLALAPIRPLLQMMADQQAQMIAPLVPESVLELKELPALTEHLLLRVRLGDDLMIRLTFQAADEAAAKELETMLTAAMDDTRAAVTQQWQAQVPFDPQAGQAMRNYIERLGGEILQLLKPVREGDRVAITIEEDVPHVALLGMLAGSRTPALLQARGDARRLKSSGQLKQIGLALHNYHDSYGGLPDPAIRDAQGKPLLSWRVSLLPFLEHAELYGQFRRDEPWDSEHNLELAKQMPDVFRHPSSTAEVGHTVYQAVVGEEIGFRPEGLTRFAEFTDGLSNTVAVVEVEDEFAVPWTKPEDITLDPDDPWPPLGGHSREGVNMLFFDGSVRLIPYWLEPEKLWHLFTRAGGEAIEAF